MVRRRRASYVTTPPGSYTVSERIVTRSTWSEIAMIGTCLPTALHLDVVLVLREHVASLLRAGRAAS
jgi:hypothetical protein